MIGAYRSVMGIGTSIKAAPATHGNIVPGVMELFRLTVTVFAPASTAVIMAIPVLV